MFRNLAIRGIQAAPSFSSCRAQATQAERFSGEIPTEQIEKRFTRSSGPGGQNIQKSLTKCEIRFKLTNASWIPEHLKDSVAQRFSNRINADGEVVIDSDRTRERSMNLADCFDKLRSTIYDVEEDLEKREESEEDRRVLMKRQEIAAQKRLEEKRRAAKLRQTRTENFAL
ncbi:unnamed protein product, partial [Mesorhabditis belari]|uniref:Large ribosomal subunit protein mL62 n=1 Tax=Mesorhabditis belari TaxID=2138241 RepID=A0AAF3F5D6_9BILA